MPYGGAGLKGVYAIADAGTLAARGVGLRAFAEGLRAAGVPVVQWRCKGASAEVLAGARLLRDVFDGTETLLVMNDRVDLALLAGFGGVHVGQGDLAVGDVRRVWGDKELVIGVSTHTDEQVLALEPRSQKRDLGHPQLFNGPDYVAVGPVFGTRTKLDAAAVVGLDGVRAARASTKKPLVAIGGITLTNCDAVRAAGANMCAVISGLVVAGRSVESVAREFMERLA